MICPYCGKENAEEVVFCAACGFDMTDVNPEEIQDSAQTAFEHTRPVRRKSRRRRRRNYKPLVFAALSIICLVVIISILSSILDGNSGYNAYNHNILVEIDSGKVAILQDAKKAKPTDLEASRIAQHQASLDGSVVAILTDKGVLAVIQRSKLTVVAENVSSFVLSVDGTGLGYVTENAEKTEYTLKLYNVKTKKSRDVTYQQANIIFDLAPDGDSLTYYVQKKGQKTFSLLYFNGKKTAPISDSITALMGLSNGGKHIYTVARDDNGDKVLYCYNQFGDAKLIGPCNIGVAYLNEDHTQILYFNKVSSDTAETYETSISNNGGNGNMIVSAESVASPLMPKNCMNFTTATSVTVPAKDLYNKVYSCWGESGMDIWMIRENSQKSVKLASNAHYVSLSENGEYVYFKTSSDWYGTLKVLKVSHGEHASEKAIVLGEDVVNYVITSDCKIAYYQTKDGIYCVNAKTGKAKKTIASGETDLGIFKNGKDVVYYMVDSNVYASKNGGKGRIVLSDAEYISSAANGIVYVFMNDDSLYATSGAKRPRLVWSED